MGHTKGQGLAGKARYVRTKNRVARLYANRMIEEYLEPADHRPPQRRPAPIRGRGDFLPAVAHADLSDETSRRTTTKPKLSGPSKPHRNHARYGPRTPVVMRGSNRPTPPPREVPIRFWGGLQARSDATRAREAIFGRRPSFTWGGFLTGCALGSAAASLLLVVMHVALR